MNEQSNPGDEQSWSTCAHAFFKTADAEKVVNVSLYSHAL